MTSARRFNVLLALVVLVSLLLSACAPPAAPAQPAAEPAAAQPAGEEAAAAPSKYGGILRHAFFAPTNLDPAFLSTVADDEITRQWAEFLVYIDEDNRPDPARSLAESWEASADGLTWTFKMRQGVHFHDGKTLTSNDAKFTFDRLRDPEVGAATVELYKNITDVQAPDDATLVITLAKPNPDFLLDLGDYHAVIVDSTTEDFKTQFNGTGPFIIDQYLPEDRLTFKRNPNYWMKDADGNQLPYLDGMEFIFMGDPSAQVEALRGGQIDYLIYLPSEFVKTLEADPNVEVYQKPSNTTFILRMRSDRGPAADVRVRQAFKAATDRKAILDAAFEGLGVTGRDTPIGPGYAELYLDAPEPVRDVEKAKQLLQEAGYGDGLTISLTTQQLSPIPAIATIWKEQLAEAGVTVEIQSVPSDVYYGADNLWLEADFAITDWGSRPYPQPYLDLAYTCAAPWNESHWCDEEMDKLAAQAANEMDPAVRAQLYKDIQQIFIDRGSIIVPFFANNLWGARSNIKGVVPTSALATALDLRRVYIAP
ncbi:MAG: Glutathione-binding protein GsiB precursor [Chloroflexi bacterium ADurb.Bin325]|nr:MAG: Glutathione-binding protein GsiB precursor [Chloroflexi bacterium ADurb.Bin325]